MQLPADLTTAERAAGDMIAVAQCGNFESELDCKVPPHASRKLVKWPKFPKYATGHSPCRG